MKVGRLLTLLGLVAEGLVEEVGDVLEDIGRNILFGLGVLKEDADAPVTKREARNTTVSVGAVRDVSICKWQW